MYFKFNSLLKDLPTLTKYRLFQEFRYRTGESLNIIIQNIALMNKNKEVMEYDHSDASSHLIEFTVTHYLIFLKSILKIKNRFVPT